MSEEKQQVRHGIESALYSNGYLGYRPRLECTCGFVTSYGNDSWGIAGEELDEHLAAAPPEGESHE